VPAGTYKFQLDAIIIDPVDVTFTLALRRDGSDTVLTSFGSSYVPIGGGVYLPQAFTYEETAPAIDFEPGDELVYEYTANGSSLETSYEPNGDQLMGTPDPNITLPVDTGGSD
jgi:hypothetical protein